MKRTILVSLIFILLVLVGGNIIQLPIKYQSHKQINAVGTMEKVVINSDKDNDGILDLADILEGARKEVANQPQYKSAYYRGGYPPNDEGVCTDVIWRAYKNAGYDLKSLVDKDIKTNTTDYPRVDGQPDPNIDFRRVQNLIVFFKKYGENLTLELKPGDQENLKQWQGGDIVIYGAPLWHIGIVSDQRRADGVPFIIHNAGPTPREEDYILDWSSPLIGHFRFPKSN